MIVLLFFLLIFTVLIGRKIYNIYINPISVFIGLFLFGFFLLQASTFISVDIITSKMKIIYLLSFACYIIGIALSRVVGTKLTNGNTTNFVEVENQSYYQQEIKIIFIIVFVSTFLYWIACVRLYGVSGIFINLLSTKETDNLNGFPTIILHLKMLSIFLSPYVLYYMLLFRDRRPFYIFVFVFTFLANIAYTRNTLFYIAILDLMIFVYSRPNTEKKLSFNWVWYFTVAFLLFKFFSYTQVLFNKQFDLKGTIMGKSADAAVMTIVSYFAGSLVSASIYNAQITNVPLLGYTLRNARIFINRFGVGLDTSSYLPDYWVYIPFKFNTASIQFYIFGEGGWIWTVLFFVFIGFLFDRTFCRYRSEGGRVRIMGLSFISLAMILSVRGYLFSRLDMLVFMITLLIVWMLNSGKFKRYIFTFKMNNRKKI